MNIGAEAPKTSWDDYNYSFLEIIYLKKSANTGNFESAYKLGMYYYLIKKNDNKSNFWLLKAAAGNHIEAIRELIRYEVLVNTQKSNDLLSKHIKQLKDIALEERKPENFYLQDLPLDSY